MNDSVWSTSSPDSRLIRPAILSTQPCEPVSTIELVDNRFSSVFDRDFWIKGDPCSPLFSFGFTVTVEEIDPPAFLNAEVIVNAGPHGELLWRRDDHERQSHVFFLDRDFLIDHSFQIEFGFLVLGASIGEISIFLNQPVTICYDGQSLIDCTEEHDEPPLSTVASQQSSSNQQQTVTNGTRSEQTTPIVPDVSESQEPMSDVDLSRADPPNDNTVVIVVLSIVCAVLLILFCIAIGCLVNKRKQGQKNTDNVLNATSNEYGYGLIPTIKNDGQSECTMRFFFFVV